LDSTGDANESAEKALRMYKEQGNTGGVGKMMHVQAMGLRMEGDSVGSLRMAEQSAKLLFEAGDWSTEVDSCILQAQMKLSVSLTHRRKQPNCLIATSVLYMATAAYKMARERRPGDTACLGEAGLTLAQVQLEMGAYSTASKYAKEASSEFRRCKDPKKQGRALLIHSSAEAQGGDWKYALKICEKATAILDEADDEAGRGFAFGVLDDIDASRRKSLGLPSREQEEAMRQKELQDKMDKEKAQQEEQMMMMMQMQMMAGAGAKMPVAQWKMPAPTKAPQAAAAPKDEAKAAPVAARKGDKLMVSAGMDAGIVRAKILDIAVSIIGDEDSIDADEPLMSAGLTSNTAVVLRDELSKDLPGVNLPPTLMFDYPSIAAIADYIVEKAS
jgi:tetratricopeptide (TPR) repeat protein